MKKQALYSFGLFVGAIALGCGGSGGVSTGPTTASFGSFTAELIGAAQPPVTTSTSYGANATGIAGAQFDKLSLTASGANTLADTKIGFTSNRDGNQEIYSMNSDGTSQTRLTNNSGIDWDPVYSPNGSKIVFSSFRDGNYEIYLMNSDGTGQTRLTNNTSWEFLPCWSPDGTKIAFYSDRDSNGEIYTMDSLGSAQTRITNNAAYDGGASWSPNGLKIAFESQRDGNSEIYVMNYDGTNQIRLTNNVAPDTTPNWSPDGTKIVFASARDGNYEIYTMNADGTSPTRITTSTSTDDSPCYSPDGTKIVFTSLRDGSDDIFVMNANGTGQTNLSLFPSVVDAYSSWSGYLPRTQKTILGIGGSLGSAAAGFIYGQVLDKITSIITFDTATTTLAARSGARVTAQTAVDSTASSLIFAVTTTTGLGTVRYAPIAADGSPLGVTNIPIPSNMSAALISISGNTGLLGSVIPYAATRAPLSQPTRVGNELTFSGSFAAILDSEGKVIAPAGASSVTINELTGKVVRYN